MTWACLVLIGVSVAVLVRAADRPPGPKQAQRRVGHAVLIGVVLLLAVACDLTRPLDVIALLLGCGGGLIWLELSGRAQVSGRQARTALTALAVTVAGLIATSGAASEPGGALLHWLTWADLPMLTGTDLRRVLLLVTVGLLNLASANVMVRLTLIAAGALNPTGRTGSTTPQPADRLRGGRLLGPMERLVILGLGLGGQLHAAGFVIAAKGLLRFPEIQASAKGNAGSAALDQVTEYFLVGSFLSWLIAFVSYGAVH